MFSSSTYSNRRNKLINEINGGAILVFGNNTTPKNYRSNYYPFRQDSNFLYFTGIDLPGLILLLDLEENECILYGDEYTVEDIIWIGNQIPLSGVAANSGIGKVKPSGAFMTDVERYSKLHYLPPYAYQRQILLSEALNIPVHEVTRNYSRELIRAVVKQRSIKSEEEIGQIEDSLNGATVNFHIKAMRKALPGVSELEIVSLIESEISKSGFMPAYNTICSVHGEILHNEKYENILKAGQLLLIDAGAENKMHYASDITRTTPVGGDFTIRQKEIYNIVLEALDRSIEAVKPGLKYRDIHLGAARIITSGLKDLGIMKGDVDEAVAEGAHALFFPHGLGHMLGLDVHDMEDLGEDNVGYDMTTKRSRQFGIANLRLARELEKGFVITVEPGIYFIPELINRWRQENMLANFINYNILDKYYDFGGIRLEDNVTVTQNGHRVLGNPVPKTVAAIESLF